MSKCPQCNKDNPDHYRFCLSCGADLPKSTNSANTSNSGYYTPTKAVSPLTAKKPLQPLSALAKKSDTGPVLKKQETDTSAIKVEIPLAIPPILDEDAKVKEMEADLLAEKMIAELLASQSKNENATPAKKLPETSSEFDLPFITPQSDFPKYAVDTPNAKAGLKLMPVFEEKQAASPIASVPEPKIEPAKIEPAKIEPAKIEPAKIEQPEIKYRNLENEHSKVSIRVDIQAPRICQQCSAVLPKGFAFCGICGARYEENIAHVTASINTTPKTGSQYYLKLIHIHPNGQEGESLVLNAEKNLIGRDHPWGIFQDDYLSPKHATFFFQNENLYLQDNGGINGSFIKLKGTAELNHGDLFRVGQQLFRFERLRNLKSAQAPDGTRRLGAPLGEIWGRLGHVIGQGEIGQAWTLQDQSIDIGRTRGMIVFSEDRFMSGGHCTINFFQDRVTLGDLGSTNGTFLRVQGTVPLSQGDLILLGQKIFRIDLGLLS